VIDYQRISITIELPDTARHDVAGAQVLLKVISWLQDEHVHTGRVAMELLPPVAPLKLSATMRVLGTEVSAEGLNTTSAVHRCTEVRAP
jgi:hypothetical protein